jgi:hypothetical protein
MARSFQDLRHIAARALGHGTQPAQSFLEGSREQGLSQKRAARLKHIEGPSSFALGHRAGSLGGAPSSAAMARVHSGCEVLEHFYASGSADRTTALAGQRDGWRWLRPDLLTHRADRIERPKRLDRRDFRSIRLFDWNVLQTLTFRGAQG